MTGLAILLPIVMTLIIVMFIINLFTKPFTGFVENILDHYGLLGRPFWIFSSTQVLLFTSKIVILILMVCLAILAGFIGQLVLVRVFFRFGDWLMHRIPLVNKIYKAIQDTLNITLGPNKKAAFSKVVLVPFPHKKSYSLGLVTGGANPESNLEYRDLITVFVPCTPNPIFGLMLMFKKSQIIPIDMKVEDALKFLVSCGVMLPNLKKDIEDQ